MKNSNARNHNNNAADDKWFNVHTEGLGYFNSIEQVHPQPGQDFEPFVSIKFCLLEGSPENVEKMFVTLTIPGADVESIIVQHWDAINDENTKVFGGIRIAKYRANPFAYGQGSQKAGQLGINYEGRLIKILTLKVGEQTVVLPKSDNQATTDFGQPAQQPSPAPAPSVPEEETLENFCFRVDLSQNDPGFEQTKERLKADGFRWHMEEKSWCLPSVCLDAKDPQLKEKREALFAANYVSRAQDGLYWVMGFPQRKQNAQPQQKSSGQRYTPRSSSSAYQPRAK